MNNQIIKAIKEHLEMMLKQEILFFPDSNNIKILSDMMKRAETLLTKEQMFSFREEVKEIQDEFLKKFNENDIKIPEHNKILINIFNSLL